MIEYQYHIPVLLRESVAGLAIKPGGIYVDLTFGGGGHSREILNQLKKGKLFAFDQDPAAAANAIRNRNFRLIQHNYRYFKHHLRYLGVSQVDGVLADLGVSSRQLDDPGRGFSFRFDTELDMRMNPDIKTNAADLINSLDEVELTRVLRMYGELNQAGRIAKRMVKARSEKAIKSTRQLVDAVKDLFPANKENKMLAQLFQAIRIAVNQELDSLQEMLLQCREMIKPGGRLVVISYHSMEDRLAKNFIKAGDFSGKVDSDFYGNPLTPFKAVNRNLVVPDEEELEQNPRSRSAKLRIAERTELN